MKTLPEQIKKMTTAMTAIALIGAGTASYEFGHLDAFAQDTKVIAGQDGNSPATELPSVGDTGQANQAGEVPQNSEMKVQQSGESQALTAENGKQSTRQGIFVLEQSENEVLANEYIGRAVYNLEGEKVGDVSDLVFAKDGGINAAIIGVGGFLGLGEKKVAIRFDAIQIRQNAGDGTMVLTIDSSQEELEGAPAFMSMAQKMAEDRAAEIERQQSSQANQNPTLPVPQPAPNNNSNN
jgi:sporulation protein YlmC with PRC-barrel domain